MKAMRSVISVPLLCLGALQAPCESQSIAVYQSEANFAEYHGVYQEPLRTWLTQRGQDFTVIGDDVAANADRLAEFAVVVASSTYVVPEPACRGIVEYIARGGRVIWMDSPARCRDADFRAALGLSPNSTYAPLQDCLISARLPDHPLAASVREISAESLAGNPAVGSAPNAIVVYDLAGTARDGSEVTYPAVIVNSHGEGETICYNWIPWLTRGPEVGALLADGLDYLLADYRLQALPATVACGVQQPTVRQPDPVVVACKAYRRKGAVVPVRCEVTLTGEEHESTPLGVPMKWTHEDDTLAVAARTVRLATDDLPDGTYSIRCRLTVGGEVAETREATVTLDGRLWARLQQEALERRRLLEPSLLGTLGDYDAEPRAPDGHVDIPRLMDQITTAHMNMYDWLIWHAPADWEDLHRFLPLARDNGIKVWITLCPPSEQGDRWSWSEPYRLDFIKWADEIGKLSKEYDNLVALVIDDFWSGGNRSLFTPAYIAKMVATLRERNPNVAFLPTIYWPTVGDEQWIKDYGPAIDGIVFPYAELETGEALADQLKACRDWLGPSKFLMVNVYASGSSGTGEKGPRSAEYMRRTLTVSREMADGIRIYCLPKAKMLEDYRYAITAELYGKWRAEGPKDR